MVPVYHLGSSQMLRCTGHAAWSRYLKASVALFWGRFGLPLPYKHDIISLVGPPLPGEEPEGQLRVSLDSIVPLSQWCACCAVTQTATPSQEDIDGLHERFVAAVKALFDEHKHFMDWEAKELVVV